MPNRKSEMTNETKNLIIGMFKAERKPFVIATELNINRSTVYKFLKRYKETESIEIKGRTGRPPKWTKRDNNQLSVHVKKNKKPLYGQFGDYSMKKGLLQCAWRLSGLN